MVKALLEKTYLMSTFKNVDFHVAALLNEGSWQTQKEFVKSLGVTEETISMRVEDMRMIQNRGNLLPYKSKVRY